LTIDYTPQVAVEGKEAGADMVIAYHPPLFKPVKRLTAGDLIFDAIRRGVAVYSPHTALDAAEGGTNDMLADVLGMETADRQPLRMVQPVLSHYKVVTFFPPEIYEKVSAAMFDAGAGHIGNYSHCGFRSAGTGTFLGAGNTNPTIGTPGKLENAQELRFETIVPMAKLNAVLAAMTKAHPYEEPAFDVVPMTIPTSDKGMGRIGHLPKPTPRVELFERIKTGLGIDQILAAGPEQGSVTRVACCAGSCGDLLDDAIAQKVELYLTGEIKHHDALKAAAAGMTVVCTLHSNSERAVLKRVQAQLAEQLPELQTFLSKSDRDPFDIR
jgi:dinuclear metal center YbgI/SA1388 family protein